MDLRHEWKHEISYSDLLAIRQRLYAVAKRDVHAVNGKYLIRSLYFDNMADKALREKLDGISNREKFRIRYYNGDTSVIRLEKIYRQGEDTEIYENSHKIKKGDIKIKEVNFDSINVETDIGDVSIEGCSLGGNIFVAADTGDISVKGFLACDIEIEADLGKVNITSYFASSAYDCDISSDLGKETISDEGGEEIEEKYNIDVVADLGNVKIVFCDN